MNTAHQFAPYTLEKRDKSVALFDANCPAFFAPNEREGYLTFLDTARGGYRVCLIEDEVVGAFGVFDDLSTGAVHLNWIMIDPAFQGSGIGRAIMEEARRCARASGHSVVRIAASHLSAPFFARFGARQVSYTAHGWGPDMHRVDMEWPL